MALTKAQVASVFGVSRIWGGEQSVSCPFHEDSNPSASLNWTKGVWRCFSCQRGGSLEGLISGHAADPAPSSLEPVEASATEVRAAAASLLRERGLEGIPAFPVDDPDSELFGYQRIASYDGSAWRYRRLFPGDPRFVAPAGEKQAFWATPQPEGRGAIVWAVEGQLDAWALARAGADHVVACGSTGLTSDLAYALRRHHVCVLFDSDPAGCLGARSAVEKLAEFGGSYSIVELPDEWGKDPCDAWSSRPTELAEWLRQKERRLGSAAGKRALELLWNPTSSPVVFSSSTSGVDEAVAGWRRGVTHLLQGMPGTGKSSYALWLCVEGALQGASVLYASLELPFREVWARVASMRKGSPTWETVERDNFTGLTKATRDWMTGLSEKFAVLCGQGIDRVEQVAERRNVDFLVVDYIQALPGGTGDDSEKAAHVAGAARRIVNWAVEADASVLVVSSMNRKGYENGGGLGAGKYSGDLEYACASVSTLVGQAPHITWRVEKNRRGKLTAVPLKGDLAHCRFAPSDQPRPLG